MKRARPSARILRQIGALALMLTGACAADMDIDAPDDVGGAGDEAPLALHGTARCTTRCLDEGPSPGPDPDPRPVPTPLRVNLTGVVRSAYVLGPGTCFAEGYCMVAYGSSVVVTARPGCQQAKYVCTEPGSGRVVFESGGALQVTVPNIRTDLQCEVIAPPIRIPPPFELCV